MITAADGLLWSPATYSAAETLTAACEPWVLVLLTDQPGPKTETGGTSDRRSTVRPVDAMSPAAGAGASVGGDGVAGGVAAASVGGAAGGVAAASAGGAAGAGGGAGAL